MCHVTARSASTKSADAARLSRVVVVGPRAVAADGSSSSRRWSRQTLRARCQSQTADNRTHGMIARLSLVARE